MHWHGEMHESSVPATIYNTWQFMFYDSLLRDFMKDEDLRLYLVANYPFTDYFQRMIYAIAEDQEDEKHNKICKGAYPEYKGKKHCVYNIARSMVETVKFLREEVSPKVENWEWRNVHTNEYPNVPWSYSPLKPLFHR